MGSNDPLENPLFIQKREYHAVKDENRTNTGPKTALPAPARCPDQLPKTKTKKQKNSPHRPHLAGRNREFFIQFYSSTRMIFAPRFRSFSTKCS